MNPDAIILSDTHIPKSINYSPVCRTDNYWETFCNKILFIKRLQKKYNNIPILNGGDLCDRVRLDPEVEAWCIENLPPQITVPGNHEIPSHNLNYLANSSLTVLEKAGKVRVIKDWKDSYHLNSIEIIGYPYGQEIQEIKRKKYASTVIVIAHLQVYKNSPDSNSIKYTKAIDLLEKLPFANLIVTGHNHDSFIVEYKGRKLINPGSMMRISSDQIEYQPKVFLWYSKNNSIKSIDIKNKKDVISDNHILNKKEKESQFESLIENLSSSKRRDIRYEKNLEAYFEENPVKRKSVKILCFEAMEKLK